MLNEKEGKKFDAGPMMSLRFSKAIPLAELKISVLFEGRFIGDLLIALQRRKYQRFAINWRIDEEDKEAKLIIWQEPTLSFNPKKKDNDEVVSAYGRVVIAQEILTGSVHGETESNLKGTLTSEELVRFQKCKYKGGGSYKYIPGPNPKAHRLIYCNRTTRHGSSQSMSNDARWALFFDLNIGLNIIYNTSTQYDKQKKHFYNKKMTREFNQLRSGHLSTVKIIMHAIFDLIRTNPEFINFRDHNITFTNEDCSGFAEEAFWEKEIRYNKENFAEHLLTTIYVAAGYDDDKPGEFWTGLSDSAIAFAAMSTALDNAIELDFNKIPSGLAKQYGCKLTTLMHAAKKKSPDYNKLGLVKRLVRNGADPTLCDAEGHDAIWYAKDSGNEEIAQYLSAFLRFPIAVQEQDIKKIDSCLAWLEVEQPLKDSETPLELVLSKQSLPAILIAILHLLQQKNQPPYFGDWLYKYRRDASSQHLFRTLLAIMVKFGDWLGTVKNRVIQIIEDSKDTPENYFKIIDILKKIDESNWMESVKLINELNFDDIELTRNIFILKLPLVNPGKLKIAFELYLDISQGIVLSKDTHLELLKRTLQKTGLICPLTDESYFIKFIQSTTVYSQDASFVHGILHRSLTGTANLEDFRKIIGNFKKLPNEKMQNIIHFELDSLENLLTVAIKNQQFDKILLFLESYSEILNLDSINISRLPLPDIQEDLELSKLFYLFINAAKMNNHPRCLLYIFDCGKEIEVLKIAFQKTPTLDTLNDFFIRRGYQYTLFMDDKSDEMSLQDLSKLLSYSAKLRHEIHKWEKYSIRLNGNFRFLGVQSDEKINTKKDKAKAVEKILQNTINFICKFSYEQTDRYDVRDRWAETHKYLQEQYKRFDSNEWRDGMRPLTILSNQYSF